MRIALLEVIRSGLSDALSEKDDMKLERKIQAVVARVPTAKVR